jgi:uncharacterized protein YuzE
MLIAYDPMSDVLSITLQAAPAAQTQTQGTIAVGLDAAGAPVSVSIPEASSALWENGGQLNVTLPEPSATVVTETVVSQPGLTQQVVEKRTVV